jgi:hypothetical protein
MIVARNALIDGIGLELFIKGTWGFINLRVGPWLSISVYQVQTYRLHPL